MITSAMAHRRHRLDLRAGAGLKPAHYATILRERPAVGFFEIHAENFMGAGGPPHRYLAEIRSHYPLSIHGVGLSLGGNRPLDAAHLARFQDLVDRYAPALVSEHLAWSSDESAYFGDLLPIPYTAQTLRTVAAHVNEVQDRLKRRILVENPSTYLQSASSTRSECDFLDELAARTGCALLLDINNVHVSAVNRGVDAAAWIDAFPLARVEQVHLAGHAVDRDEDDRPLLIDTHDRRVDDAVWGLYARVLRRIGPVPTLVEWDNAIPSWSTLFAECRRADAEMDGATARSVEPLHAAA